MLCKQLTVVQRSVVLSLFSVTASYALEIPQTETFLEEVVISASRAPTALGQTPAAVSVVNSQTLDRDKPRTMGDVLNRFSGVYWNDLGNEQHSMGIRQPISTNAVYQYLEDGIPIRPLGVFNHNSLNELNMSGAEQVEVVKGPSSSLYGSSAVGGAINLITAAPSVNPYASVAVRTDAVSGYRRYDTAFSDTFGDFGVRLSHYSSRRDNNNWQEYSGGAKDSVTLRADYSFSQKLQMHSTLVYSNLDTAMTGSLFEADYLSNPGKSINTFTYRKDKSLRATVGADVDWAPDATTTFTGFWRRNDHGQLPSYTITGCSGATCKGTINNNHVDSIGLDIKHVLSLGWLDSRFIGGIYLDSSRNPYVSDNLSIVRDTTTGRYLSYTLNNLANPTGVRDYQTAILNYAPFLQFELSPYNALRVVIGGRYDAIRYDFENHLTPGASYGAANEKRSFSRLSPKLGFTYAFTQKVNVYANASEGFTAPDVSQLYGKSAIPDLKPAIYRNYEAGLRMGLLDGKIQLESVLYRLTGKDTIVSYTIAPGNSENRNAGRTRSQGVELSVAYTGDRFDARFAGSAASHRYEEYKVSSSLDYSGKEMPQAPEVYTAEIGYRPILGLRLSAEGVRQSAYWMNNANTVRYDGHTLLNLRGVYELNDAWQLWAQGRNVTDDHYADSAASSYTGTGAYTPNTQNTYTPAAPRTLLLGVTYTFKK